MTKLQVFNVSQRLLKYYSLTPPAPQMQITVFSVVCICVFGGDGCSGVLNVTLAFHGLFMCDGEVLLRGTWLKRHLLCGGYLRGGWFLLVVWEILFIFGDYFEKRMDYVSIE